MVLQTVAVPNAATQLNEMFHKNEDYLFVVELDKQIKDTITTDGGLELYVDSKWNEFKHRVTEGPVVCAPLKHDTGVENRRHLVLPPPSCT